MIQINFRRKKCQKRTEKKRHVWTKEEQVTLMECYYKSNPAKRGYLKRLHIGWMERKMYEHNQQQLGDQVRSISKRKVFSDKEMEDIRKRVMDTNQRQTTTGSHADNMILGNIMEEREEQIEEDPHAQMEIDSRLAVIIEEEADEQETGGESEERRGEEVPEEGSSVEESEERRSEEESGQRLDGSQEDDAEELTMSQYIRDIRQEVTDNTPFAEDTIGEPLTLNKEETELKEELLRAMCDIENLSEPKPLRNVNKKKLEDITKMMNTVTATIGTNNITETNIMIRTAAVIINEKLGVTNQKRREKKEPMWKRRMQLKIDEMRKDVGRLEEMKKGKKLKSKIVSNLKKRYQFFEKKGIKTIQEELKQRITAKADAIRRYTKRCKRFGENRMFDTNERQFYRNLDANEEDKKKPGTHGNPDKDECTKFWSNIWNNRVEHNRNATWLKDIETDLNDIERQRDLIITLPMVRERLGKMANWKAAGPDGVHGYWLKHLKSLHIRIADQLNDCITSGQVPEWMTTGKTFLLIKDPAKGPIPSNYRPITCLPMVWKLMTGTVSEYIYKHLIENNLMPDEQKGCKKKSRGCKELLLIDKMILKNCKRRKTNLYMGYIDYRKAYDMVPHSWILSSMKMLGVADNILKMVEASMDQSKVELTHNGETLGLVDIKRGIFQGDSLSPLEFVMSMIPLTLLLRKDNSGYEMEKGKLKISHRLYMDDIKLFARSEEQLDSLVKAVKEYSDDIKMEFGLDKCAVIKMERGKRRSFDGITLPDGGKFDDVEEGGYKYLGILEADKILHDEMKKKVKREYLRRTRKILKSMIDGKKTIKALNTWAVPIIRYGAGILDWTQEEIQTLDRKTRKMLTGAGAHHPRSDVDRLYVDRKEGGRGLISVEDCVRREENALTTYIQKTTDHGIEAARPHMIKERVLMGEVVDKDEDKERRNEQRKDGWEKKIMHGQYQQQTKDIKDPTDSWKWLTQQDLHRETEGLIIAAQDQSLSTNYIKNKIHGQDISPKCRLCGDKDETIDHILNGCPKLAQSEYKKRHDKVAAAVHWSMCKNYHIPCPDKWYNHQAEKVIENDEVKILWDFNIQTGHVIQHRRPDIVLIKKAIKKMYIIDIAVPGDTRLKSKEADKILAYQELKIHLKTLWQLRSATVVPVVVGALGGVTGKLKTYLKDLECRVSVPQIQKTALLGSARIIRQVLDVDV